MIQSINVSTARQDLSKILNLVFRERKRIMVEKSGIPIAAIISTDDMKRFNQMEQEREERFHVLDSVKAAFKGISAEEIEHETDKAVAEARKELRQEQ